VKGLRLALVRIIRPREMGKRAHSADGRRPVPLTLDTV